MALPGRNPWTIRQHSNDKLPGIGDNVDRNAFGSREEYEDFAGLRWRCLNIEINPREAQQASTSDVSPEKLKIAPIAASETTLGSSRDQPLV